MIGICRRTEPRTATICGNGCGRDDAGPRHGEPLEVVRRPSAEGGERERDHEHDREDDEQREPAGSTRRARLPTFDAPPPNGA